MGIFDAFEEWARLGSAVREQALAVVNGEGIDNQNVNALKMIGEWAQRWRHLSGDIGDLAEEITEYLIDC